MTVRLPVLFLVALASLAACDGGPSGSEPPARLEVVSGTTPLATLGAVAAESVSVRVTDADGEPVKGAQVTWTVEEGGGSVPASTLTDAEGVAAVRWTLGNARAQRLRAALGTLDPVTFTTPRELIAAVRSDSGVFSTPSDSVIVFDPDRSERRAFPVAPDFADNLVAPVWSPAGDLAFVASEFAVEPHSASYVTSHIWRIRSTGGAPQEVVEGRVSLPSWSPDGARFAYSTEDGRVRVMNADGSGGRDLAAGWAPTWMADGRIFYQAGDPYAPGLWSVGSEGGTPAQLSPVAGIPSPDGTRLVVRRWVEGEGEHLRVVKLDGTGDVRVTSGTWSFIGGITWSPDGTRLAYVPSNTGTRGIHVARADGSGSQAVTPPVHFHPRPAWSPDGRTIAFNGAQGMYVVPADGSAPEQRLLYMVANGAPAWRP